MVLGKKKDEKKLGYYKIENIDNICLLTLAVNAKVYLELLKDMLLNKKQGSTGISLEYFVQRIKSLVSFDTFEKPPLNQKQVSRFSVAQGEMIKNSSKN